MGYTAATTGIVLAIAFAAHRIATTQARNSAFVSGAAGTNIGRAADFIRCIANLLTGTGASKYATTAIGLTGVGAITDFFGAFADAGLCGA